MSFAVLMALAVCWDLVSLRQPRRAPADDLPIVSDVEFQPLSAQAKRVVETLELLGQPLTADEKRRVEQAIDSTGGAAAIKTIQQALDPHCLIGVEINPESRVKAAQGPGPALASCSTAGGSSWSRSTTRRA